MDEQKIQTTLTPREAAQLLGIRLDAVYGLVWAARLKAVKRDGRWLVDGAAVETRIRAKRDTNLSASAEGRSTATAGDTVTVGHTIQPRLQHPKHEDPEEGIRRG